MSHTRTHTTHSSDLQVNNDLAKRDAIKLELEGKMKEMLEKWEQKEISISYLRLTGFTKGESDDSRVYEVSYQVEHGEYKQVVFVISNNEIVNCSNVMADYCTYYIDNGRGRALKHIKKWQTPQNYLGNSPVNDYLIYSVHRDSSLLEVSNYQTLQNRLEAFDIQNERVSVYEWRANHFLVGWVDYLMIEGVESEGNIVPEHLTEILKTANGFLEQIEQYAILDEEDHSQRQEEAVCAYWEGLDLGERVELCQECDITVFAARHKYDVPIEVRYYLEETIY